MESKDTNELLKIFEENDRDKYSGEAFCAIKQILNERGQGIPAQKEKTSIPIRIDNPPPNDGDVIENARLLKELYSRYRKTQGKRRNTEEVLDSVKKHGSVMRIVPQEEEALFNHADSMIEQASQCMASKQYEKAVAVLNEVLSVLPNHFGAYINRGNAYRRLNHNEKAINDYLRAIAISPRTYLAHVNLAAVYIDMGKKKEALKLYRDALAMIPADSQNDMKVVKGLMDKVK
jgi:tetratricopeptide (TPR) repeat protein